jgi:hypothetical protein
MITYDDFRAEEGLRLELANFLKSDVGMILMRVMRDKYKPSDVPHGSDALVSARILSQYHGAHTCLDEIEQLAQPLLPAIPIEATYDAENTDHARMPSEFDLTPQVVLPKGLAPEEVEEQT